MLNLYINHFWNAPKTRLNEFKDCLSKNLDNPLINNIYIRKERLTYKQWFEYINQITNTNDINILANSDIYFNDTLKHTVELTETTLFTLSRWEGNKVVSYAKESQDSWIWRGKLKEPVGNFYLGIPGCDNRIAWELRNVGYQISNPSLTIQSFHLHKEQSRNWTETIPQPYLLIESTQK